MKLSENIEVAPSAKSGMIFALVVTVIFGVLLPLLTMPRFLGDTSVYAREILAYMNHSPEAAIKMNDFGHLGWRWTGLVIFETFRPFWMWLGWGNDYFAMSWCLIGMTRVTMCLGLYFLCRLLSRYTANRWIVFGGCLAFACQHAVLDYSGAGTSYVAGVCFMITAIYFVLEAAQGDGRRPSSYAPMWRELNATYILEPWAKGGDIWIANRMLAQRPKPEWLWTEGDDPFTKWNDVYAFYHQFEYADAHLGGEDGFTMIKDSPSNRQILEPLVKKYADWLLTQQHSSSPAETSPNK